jgi:hypothetical protein
MKRFTVRKGKTLTVSSTVAEKVALAAARLGMTKEQALAIAKAEPKGATIFAGAVTLGSGRRVARTARAACAANRAQKLHATTR